MSADYADEYEFALNAPCDADIELADATALDWIHRQASVIAEFAETTAAIVHPADLARLTRPPTDR